MTPNDTLPAWSMGKVMESDLAIISAARVCSMPFMSQSESPRVATR